MTVIVSVCIVMVLVVLLWMARNSPKVLLLKGIENGNIDLVEKALSKGVDCKKPLGNGSLPIVLSALYGDVEIVKLLISKGVDLSDGLAVHGAAMAGDIEIATILVNAGANINGTDMTHKGKTPLMVAAEFNNQNIVDFLLKQGADENIVDIDGKKWREYLSNSSK